MDINQLDQFRLSDAVKFHDKLNPKLWHDHKLDIEVKGQLLIIAKDFISYLGIHDLLVEDITISGSNAAYSYTPHSDLDLHILVDFSKLPENDVYRELFTAKKQLYNDNHDIRVKGINVELYVQDSNEPVVSLGEYSVLHDKWIKAPKKTRANFDQHATMSKYEHLLGYVLRVLKTKNSKEVSNALKLIKRYRQAGLDKGGEFGPENLAYKAVRAHGLVDKLYNLRDKLHSQDLSIDEMVEMLDEDMSRDSAISKIRKLQNFSGRTPEEVDTAKRMIEKLMQKYNISVDEIGGRVDPLTSKIANAQYQKNQAAGMLKSEWERYKKKFKGIFTEDEEEVLNETTAQIQYIHQLSNIIATDLESSFSYKKPDIVPGAKPKVLQVCDVSNLNLPATDDRYINRLKDTLYVVMLDYINDDTGNVVAAEYYPKMRKIVMSKISILRLTSRQYNIEPPADELNQSQRRQYYRKQLIQQISKLLTHEITHALDGIKMYPKSIGKNHETRDEYLRDQLEINARFSEALHDMIEIIGRYASDKKTMVQRDNLVQLIKYTFAFNELHIFPKDSPEMKRLIKRTYMFLDKTLNDPNHPISIEKVQKNPNFIKKAVNWILSKTNLAQQTDEDYDPNGPPPGPEFKPTMPAGTVRVDVSDVYDWYKLGQHVSNMKGLGKHDFGKGPPSTVFSFGDEDTEHKYIKDLEKTGLTTTDIDPVDPNQPKGMKKQKVDPTYNVNEEDTNDVPAKSVVQFKASPRPGKPRHSFRVVYDGKIIASGEVEKDSSDEDDRGASVQEITVHPKYRRLGIASKVYDAIERKFKYKLHPSDDVRPEGQAFWKSRQVNEASGYIPSEKEKNDPRFKTALTVDVRPDSIKKNAKSFNWKTSRAGIPPEARTNGKISESKLNELTGYRQVPVYKIMAQCANVPEIVHKMAEMGYDKDIIGTGYFAMAWSRPQDRFVYKLWDSNDFGYNSYLQYVLSHQDNPHVPKIYGRPMRLLNRFYVVKMEKLVRHSAGFTGRIKDVSEIISRYVNLGDVTATSHDLEGIYTKLDELFTQYPRLQEVLDFILSNREMDIDLGQFGARRNILWRNETPVITDPWAAKSGKKDFTFKE